MPTVTARNRPAGIKTRALWDINGSAQVSPITGVGQYQPGNIATAILALEWDVGYEARALLPLDGTLKFNYYDRRYTIHGGTIRQVFAMDTNGYSSACARSWDSIKLLMKKVYIDSSISGLGITNCAYWFNAFVNCAVVSGFENLSGMTNAAQMFSSCSSLETIYATSFNNTGLSGPLMFNGCTKLVGRTDGFAPSNTSGANVCKIGTGGVLTNPNNDARTWFYGHFYEDGEAVLTASATPETNGPFAPPGTSAPSPSTRASASRPGRARRVARTGSTSRARPSRKTWPCSRT